MFREVGIDGARSASGAAGLAESMKNDSSDFVAATSPAVFCEAGEESVVYLPELSDPPQPMAAMSAKLEHPRAKYFSM